MNTEHRYKLEQGSKKYHCPECNKKTFVLYIDTETGNYLPERFGRCDRESKCGYFLNPYVEGYVNTIGECSKGSEYSHKWELPRKRITHQPQPVEPTFFDFDTFKRTLEPERYEKNTFLQNLFFRVQFPFEIDTVTKVVQLYRLGTVANGYRAGAITFPFIDIKNNVRAIQVKQFDEQNHTTGTDFLHSIIEKRHNRDNKPLPEWLKAYSKQDKRISCLFGEHLLDKYPNNPVALVEAPKTAVYGSLYFGLPENTESIIWLAVYNKSSFSFDKLKVLQGRFIYVFPDLSKDGITFTEWESKANEYENRLPGTRFIFSDLLERLAPDQHKVQGNDLADYLIKQDWRLFRKQVIQEQPPQTEKSEASEQREVVKTKLISHASQLPKVEVLKSELPVQQQPQSWSKDIAELETYFASIELPAQPLELNKCSTIRDCRRFLETHFATVKRNNGNRTFLPYLNRLKELRLIIEITI